MKKYAWYLLLLLPLIGLVISCSQEEISDQAEIENLLENEKMQQRVVAPPPDLIISLYSSTISNQTTLCTDTPLPNTHCNGGDRIFKSLATIQNAGAGTLPAGSIKVLWRDLTWGLTATTSVSHSGLAPGASIIASKQYYVGPCDCADLPPMDENCFVHSYEAVVDWGNAISESNEGNNTSAIFDTCDGCGPCSVIGEPNPTEPVDPL